MDLRAYAKLQRPIDFFAGLDHFLSLRLALLLATQKTRFAPANSLSSLPSCACPLDPCLNGQLYPSKRPIFSLSRPCVRDTVSESVRDCGFTNSFLPPASHDTLITSLLLQAFLFFVHFRHLQHLQLLLSLLLFILLSRHSLVHTNAHRCTTLVQYLARD